MFSYSFDHKVTNIFTALHFIPDKNYSWPLNSTSLNYASLLIHRFFFHKYYSPIRAFQVALVLKNLLAIQETSETWVRSLGREDPLEEGVATHSYLENPMDRGAWQAMVNGVPKRWTSLEWLSTHATALRIKTIKTQRARRSGACHMSPRVHLFYGYEDKRKEIPCWPSGQGTKIPQAP